MTAAENPTVGEALVSLLEQAGVDTVFGIPGVHTIELYRGLAASRIRHVTPRHEQGAAFMADGHARVTGRPGVCLLITGPGLTNALTAMAQARADSIPMLVITGVNARPTLGKGFGHLHELPDQAALARSVAVWSQTLHAPDELEAVFSAAFARLSEGRPGPVHIEIPTDVMAARIAPPRFRPAAAPVADPDPDAMARAAARLAASRRPVILAGGGAVKAAPALRQLAAHLDAPVVQTVNARGILNKSGEPAHPLSVPASPSLGAVRALLGEADCVLAIGTEFGPTDYDMYETGTWPALAGLIRVDCDAAQLSRRAGLASGQIDICADAGRFVSAVLPMLAGKTCDGAARASAARAASLAELSPRYRAMVRFCEALWHTRPAAVIVGDSTQPIYAGNLYLDAPAPGRWFNSATGYGTLGYAVPAAIGAALALGESRAGPQLIDVPEADALAEPPVWPQLEPSPRPCVICLAGDGGFQFSMAELGAARDENADVSFVIWNNNGYQEIESSMVAVGIAPEGVRPVPPDFGLLAKAYGI